MLFVRQDIERAKELFRRELVLRVQVQSPDHTYVKAQSINKRYDHYRFDSDHFDCKK